MTSPAKHLAGQLERGIHADASLCLYVSGIAGDSIVDGPGLRVTIFCQGCPHHCPGCHNPETHPFVGGTPLRPKEVYDIIKKYPLCNAVTLSGGEPFSQASACLALAHLLKADGYELSAYSGYTLEQLLQGSTAQQELLCLLDTLVDGPYLEEERDLTLRFRGSRNQRILDMQQSLASHTAVLEASNRWTG